MKVVASLLRNPWMWLALALAGGGGFLYWRPPPEVRVVSVRTREVVEVVVVSGQLRAVREARLGIELGGTIEEVAVREGDRVKAGAVLARLHLVDFDQQLAQAQARRLSAEKDLAVAAADRTLAEREAERINRLFAQQVVAPDEQDRAAATHTRAAAALEAAEARLHDAAVQIDYIRRQAAKREVRAPFDGLVVRRLAEPGQSVTPGEALLWVAETAHQEIYVETDENNLGKLRPGQRAVVAAPAFRDRPFGATLALIGPRVDWDRGLVGLRLTPGTLPDYALPNMTVDVSIESNRWSGKIAVPAAAVLRDRTGGAVLQVEGDRLIRRTVTILGENPEWIAVEGLPAGARVAVNAAGAKEGRRGRWIETTAP